MIFQFDPQAPDHLVQCNVMVVDSMDPGESAQEYISEGPGICLSQHGLEIYSFLEVFRPKI